MSKRSLRPFSPERPKTGLFVFERDPDDAPPLATYRDLLAIKKSDGLRGDALTAFWDEVWDRGEYDLDTLYPFIVRVAWRLTRALATAKGMLSADDALGEFDPIVWETPALGTKPSKPNTIERKLTFHELPLLPPAPPAEWMDGSKDATYYDPASDVALCTFVEVIGALSRRLGIPQRKEGRLGLAPIMELAMTRAAWPTPREMVAYESVMIDEATQALLKHGTLGARRQLMGDHGFSEAEVMSLCSLARRVMRGVRNGADTDGDKAEMVARLEDLASRCRESLDLRAELMVYKTLAVVQGLTKTQGVEEDVDDMVDVAGEVARETELLEEGSEGDSDEE